MERGGMDCGTVGTDRNGLINFWELSGTERNTPYRGFRRSGSEISTERGTNQLSLFAAAEII